MKSNVSIKIWSLEKPLENMIIEKYKNVTIGRFKNIVFGN